MKGLLLLAPLLGPPAPQDAPQDTAREAGPQDTGSQTPQEAAMGLVRTLARMDVAAWEGELRGSMGPERMAQARELPARLHTDGFGPTLGAPWPTNKGRAVVPLTLGPEGPTTLLCLAQAPGGTTWGLADLFEDPVLAREWLFEEGREGAEPSPERTMAAFLIAVRDRDALQAERVCTYPCWVGRGGDSTRRIFQAARLAPLEFTTSRVVTRGERAVAHMRVHVGEQPIETTDFYLVRRPEGWLIAGLEEEELYAERFLSGARGPNPWLATPEEAVGHLARALRDRLRQRLTAVCTDPVPPALLAFHGAMGGSRTALGVSPVEETVGDRSLARVALRGPDGEPSAVLWLELLHTPDGWRVAGATRNEAEARTFHEGPAGR